jgi:hypothetical protein
MLLIISLAFTLFIVYIVARKWSRTVVKAVPAYVPQRRLPNRRRQKLLFPPYHF